MGLGPTRYFATAIHEFTQALGKERFLLMGEIAGNNGFETVEITGIDAAGDWRDAVRAVEHAEGQGGAGGVFRAVC